MRIHSAFIACAVVASCSAGWAAAPLPQPAAFLTDGLAAPYFSAFQVARMIRVCVTEFSQQCRSEKVSREDLESVDPAIFERVTVLGREPAKPLHFADHEEFVHAFVETRDEFMREYFAYEKQLLPRIGAVYAMCPESDTKHAELIDTIRLVNFGRYWPLSAATYKSTLAEIAKAQAQHMKTIRKQWTREQCIQARELAFDLIRLFSSKLRPFLDDDWEKLGKGDRTAAGVLNIWYSGMRAEGVLHPEIFTEALDNGPKPPH